MILTKVSRLRGLLHRNFPSLEVRHFSEGIGELNRSQELRHGSILPIPTKCGTLFVSKEVTPIARGNRCGRYKRAKSDRVLWIRRTRPLLVRDSHAKVFNSLVQWVWKHQIRTPPSWDHWHFCIEFWNWFLEKIRKFIAPFLVFTYSVFMFMNNNKRVSAFLVTLTLSPTSLTSTVKLHGVSVSLRAKLCPECLCHKSYMCVSEESPLPQLLYINVQLTAVKKFLFLAYLTEETMEGNGDSPTAMAISYACDALP